MRSGAKFGLVAAFTVAAALVMTSAALAANGGNSANAKLCQNGGWQNVLLENGTSPRNEGACISHAAQGGIVTPKSDAQLLCESLGGSYGGPQGESTLWTCNGWFVADSQDRDAKVNTFARQCEADGGGPIIFVTHGVPGLMDFTCLRAT